MTIRTSERMSRLPRWVHRAYARVFGYFWLSCPQCGRLFGGHEADGNYLTIDSLCVCPACRRTWDRETM